ncbi:MAG: hypothetical protein GC202_07545 [Alphaproteobacteria bacterium]|nr:hypothetical protein [Alphaproteobacteria bacterium]
MTAAVFLLGFVTVQRLLEVLAAARNTAALRERGAVEYGASHYPFMIALHTSWLGGLWLLGHGVAPDMGWLAVYAVLQVVRIWIRATLGRRWTTRILVVPGERLVRAGPYRFIAHPNYVVVVGEIAVLPLCLGLPVYALVFSLLNAVMLAVRIRVENAALAAAKDQ